MKGSRRQSRELALQGLYQWLLNESDAEQVLAQLAEKEGYARSDQALLAALVDNVIADADLLHEKIAPLLDRPIAQLSPIEHAVLLMAASEMRMQPETPYRVVINEAVELAKAYGGTDGHKYVNGVLDKLAVALRPSEVHSRANRGGA
jgi:N utilization substance protein B